MRIAIGNDHRGLSLKQQIVPLLKSWGHDVSDEGAQSAESSDYPDYAARVARKVASGEAERGLLLCGSGIGMAIAANKVHGVRATIVCDEKQAEMCRRHNDVNVLCLSEDQAGNQAQQFLKIWLETPFDGGRHARRVDK